MHGKKRYRIRRTLEKEGIDLVKEFKLYVGQQI